jgi:hypothetical protein
MQHHCPHCGRETSDEFELLDDLVQHMFRCDVCQKIYFMYFAECPSCLNDSIFCWRTQATARDLFQLRCQCCAEPLGQAEAPNST